MRDQTFRSVRLTAAVSLCLLLLLSRPALPVIKNTAIVAAAGSKLNDVPMADLVKLCKGAEKAWPDGREFTLVIKGTDDPATRMAVQKLFNLTNGDMKAVLAKANESRQVVKIVDSDDTVMQTVASTPGAIGLVDVYSINSSVKVLRVDGKLPFDVGYALKGNA
jgi:hypothetical protein